MSSSNTLQSDHQLEIPERKIPILETPNPDTKPAEFQENPAESVTLSEEDLGGSTKDGGGDQGEEEEEEEGECGFCLFMKGGGCKETFIEWEKCVEEAEKKNNDIVEKCFQATSALKKCMEAHSDYYAPILQAEKSAEAEAAQQLEEEKQRLNSNGGGGEESGKMEKEEALKASDPN